MFLHQHTRDEARMYFLGTLDQTATVMLFDKGSMNIDYTLKIKRQDANGVDLALPETRMNEIHSYIQPRNKGSIYACGYASKTLIKKIGGADEPFEIYSAAMFKMSVNKGEIDYLYAWGQAVEDKVGHIDKCKVITYDYENRELVMMVETTNADLRPSLSRYSDSKYNTDVVILTMSENGRF